MKSNCYGLNRQAILSGKNIGLEHRKLLQPFKYPIFLLYMLAAAIIFCSADIVSAVEKPLHGQDVLMGTYQKYKVKLEASAFGLPLSVESFELDNRAHVDVYGIFDFPFSTVVDLLKNPGNWCEIVFLHPNVKTCTYKELGGEWLLNFYFGRKTYQHPEDSVLVISRFRNVTQHQGYLDITLNAEEGPFSTKDHRMRFEALQIAGGRTFVHVSYAYSESAALHLAAKIYFATLGRGKVGFTVTGNDRNNNPEYIGGTRGAIERSAVRYYLAIQSYMNTMRYPEESRFSKRISEWHDLTTRYKKQLLDLEKDDYIELKAREHKNQVLLQRTAGAGLK
jgi:hypothetical protein